MNSKLRNTWVLAIFMTLGMTTALMADGNITVEVNNGKLKATGQNNTSQEVLVTQVGPTSMMFESIDGTTLFNGLPELLVTGITSNVQFDLKSGPKVLAMFPGNSDDLAIDGNLKITSTGSDNVFVFLVEALVTGRTDISTRNGNDVVLFFGGQYQGRVQVKTGNGNDVVGLQDANVQNKFAASMGNGSDFVVMFGSIFQGLTDLKMGGGDDGIAAEFSTFANVKFNGNGGIDELAEANNMFLGTQVLRSLEIESDDPAAVANLATLITPLQEAIELLISLL